MALITETGTGSATSESYCSVAQATAYHAGLGNAAWASLADDAARERLLRRATIYMGQAYRLRWAGSRVNSVQALDWPRAWVPVLDSPAGYASLPAYYPSDAVPVEVRNACAELALRAISGDLLGDQGQTVIEQTVGPITTKYAAGSTPGKAYSAVDAMLRPLLKDGGSRSSVRVVRA